MEAEKIDDIRYTERGMDLTIYMKDVIVMKTTIAIDAASRHLKNSYISAYLHMLS